MLKLGPLAISAALVLTGIALTPSAGAQRPVCTDETVTAYFGLVDCDLQCLDTATALQILMMESWFGAIGGELTCDDGVHGTGCAGIIFCQGIDTVRIGETVGAECSGYGTGATPLLYVMLLCVNVAGCGSSCAMDAEARPTSSPAVGYVPAIGERVCVASTCATIAPNSGGLILSGAFASGFICKTDRCAPSPVLCTADGAGFQCHLGAGSERITSIPAAASSQRVAYDGAVFGSLDDSLAFQGPASRFTALPQP